MFRRNLLRVLPFLAAAPLGAKYFKNKLGELPMAIGGSALAALDTSKEVTLKIEDLLEKVEKSPMLHTYYLFHNQNATLFFCEVDNSLTFTRITRYNTIALAGVQNKHGGLKYITETTVYDNYKDVVSLSYIEGSDNAWVTEKEQDDEASGESRVSTTYVYNDGTIKFFKSSYQYLGVASRV